MTIGKILLPFDGSVHSLNAARYALEVAKISQAQVTLITCYDEGKWDGSGISDFLVEGIKANRKKTAYEMVKKAEVNFTDHGVRCQCKAIAGEPGDILTHQAKSKEFDLIIMGSHGHSNIEGLFLGSVTHKVLDTIHCPVMIVP